MALILQLETSTTSCSVALSFNGETLAVKEVNERNVHASNITLFIEEVMAFAGKTMQDLEAVAVSMGPGSYTGLRIGVSTAKGLCYALDIPLIAIDTLLAMAYGFKCLHPDFNGLYCPMIDARRMEVYSAVYNSELKEVLPVAARIIDEYSFSELFQNQQVVFFGDGAMKCEQAFSSQQNAAFIPDFTNSAAHLSMLTFEKFKAKDFKDVAYFEPYYLKDFLVTQPKPK